MQLGLERSTHGSYQEGHPATTGRYRLNGITAGYSLPASL